MKVYGYTEAKETVAVDLSFNEIASAGIDPWRLDLFDPDPVVLPGPKRRWLCFELSGKNLYFSRLRDLSFAYRDETGAMNVGIHDGSGGTCIRAALVEAKNMILRCTNIAASDRSFADHFAEYLSQYCAGEALQPRRASAVALKGNGLEYGYCGTRFLKWLHDPICYSGEMLETLSPRVVLPQSINRVFTLFEKWRPAVHGTPLRQALRGKKHDCVLVTVDEGARSQIKEKFGTRTPHYFEIDGVEYSVRERSGARPGLLGHWGTADCLSARGLYSLRPNEVIGSRIDWFDLAKSQVRRLHRFGTKEIGEGQLSLFEEEKLKPLPSPVAQIESNNRWSRFWQGEIPFTAGTPGKLDRYRVPAGATVGDALELMNLNVTGYDVRMNASSVHDMNQPIQAGATILLFKPIVDMWE